MPSCCICQFGPGSTLYMVDWGEIETAPERGEEHRPIYGSRISMNSMPVNSSQ